MTMKKYVLLRDNKQFGPYSLEEIKAAELRSSDLVWEENFSTEWQYPNQITELKHYVKEQPADYTCNDTIYSTPAVYNNLPPTTWNDKDIIHQREAVEIESMPDTGYAHPFEEVKENYAVYQEPKSLWKKRLPEHNILNLAAVFIGLIIGTFFLKKIVDGLVETTFNTEQRLSTMPVIAPHDKIADKDYQNALVTELVRPVIKEKTRISHSSKLKDIKKQIKLKGTDYKVGFFGGIHGLQLTISNASPHFVNQVEVELNYLKSNGQIVETNTYKVKGMNPGSSQTLSIPPSKRGVKVSYKVLNIYSKQYRLSREI